MQHNTIVSLVGLVAVAAAVEKVFNIELMKYIKNPHTQRNKHGFNFCCCLTSGKFIFLFWVTECCTFVYKNCQL